MSCPLVMSQVVLLPLDKAQGDARGKAARHGRLQVPSSTSTSWATSHSAELSVLLCIACDLGACVAGMVHLACSHL